MERVAESHCDRTTKNFAFLLACKKDLTSKSKFLDLKTFNSYFLNVLTKMEINYIMKGGIEFSTNISPGFLIFQVARIARIPFCTAMVRSQLQGRPLQHSEVGPEHRGAL